MLGPDPSQELRSVRTCIVSGCCRQQQSHYHLSSHTRNGHIPKAQLCLASQSWLLRLGFCCRPCLGRRGSANTVELAFPPQCFQKDLRNLPFPKASGAPVWCLYRPGGPRRAESGSPLSSLPRVGSCPGVKRVRPESAQAPRQQVPHR